MNSLLSRSFYFRKCFSPFSTSAAVGDMYTAMAGAPKKLNQMVAAEMRRLERRRVIEKVKPKKLNFADTEKAKSFNRIFQENLTMLLTFDRIREKINFLPLHITKVRVAPGFDQVFVYWTTVLANGEELEKLLDLAAGDLRHEIQQYALMGRIPKIGFLKENEVAVENAMKKLVEAVEELKLQEKESSNLEVRAEGIELRTDILINRSKILDQILERLEHAAASHRVAVPDTQSFTQHP